MKTAAKKKAASAKKTRRIAPPAPRAVHPDDAAMSAIVAAGEVREAYEAAAAEAARDDAVAAATASGPVCSAPHALTREFFTAGLACFTVKVPAEFVFDRVNDPNEKGDWKTAYTFGVRKTESGGKVWYFVESVDGDKGTYLGVLEPDTGVVRLTKRSRFPAHSSRVRVATRVLKAIWDGRAEAVARAGWAVEHAGRCAGCREANLFDRVSAARGVCPDCCEVPF